MSFQNRSLLKTYYLFLRDFFKDLFDDRLGYYASSLSWNTLFAIVPLLVVVLYIFTNLPVFNEVYDKFQEMLFANLMPTQSQEVIGYINRFIANADKLGYLGVVYVTFALVMFFKDYDFIVNDIFELPRRGVMRSVRTYIVLLISIPTMIGLSFYLSLKIQAYFDSHEATRFIHLYYFVPYLIVWGMFYIAYQLSARKHIDPKAALASSFIASLIWYGGKSAFVFYVVHNKTYATLYGSVSTLLFFFLWIYISWAIFLHGLRLCHLLDEGVDFDRI